jgi:acyl transferase domain-containing protein
MPLSAASEEGGGVVVGSLRREAGGMSELLQNLSVLHCHGVAIDWEKVLGGSASKRLVALPTYAFQRQRYWLEAQRASGDASTMGLSSVAHPLLGAATPLADSERFLLTGRLSVSEPGWLGDHAVFGTVLVPGTGLLELGFAAARGGRRDDGVAADVGNAAGAAGSGGGAGAGAGGCA